MMERIWDEWAFYVTRGDVLKAGLGITRTWFDKLVEAGTLVPIDTGGGWKRYLKYDVIRVFGLEEAWQKGTGKS